LSFLKRLFFTTYPASDYPGKAKSKRMETISEYFHKNHECDCALTLFECRAVVNRFGDLTNKGKYSQTALVAYIKEQFGVDASGSMDELRRLAMLGPSM
jgi:hypothetical protein